MELDNPQKDKHSAAQPTSQNVYDELKGYFPEQYDLTPQELEETIRQRKNEFTDKQAKRTVARPKTVPAPRPPQPEWSIEEELAKYESPTTDIKKVWDDSLAFEETEQKSPVLRFFSEAFDILEVFVLCAACIILVFAFVARLTRVDGYSMEDTLQNGEFLIVSDLFYTPKQGDIVVLHNTSLEVEQLREPLVKRIIAVGGQTVNVAPDGTVTVTDADGTSKVLEEMYIKQEPYDKNSGEWYVPQGHIFVMGDNRNNSTDSRDDRVDIIDERCVCGRAILRVFPFTSISFFKNPMTE